jgi:hypothetical protein
MTTRVFSRTMMAAFTALAEMTAACGTSSPAGPTGMPAATDGSQAPAPVVAAIQPDTGSTGGSTPVKIIGSGFQPGATVSVDGIQMGAFVLDSGTIHASTPPHGAGKAEVVVTNPDGASGRIANAYTYVPPRMFDFNGDWIGVAGAEHQRELRFTVRDNVLVSVSCGTSGTVTFSPPPEVHSGEFSILRSDGVGISARIVSASDAVGTINIEPCPSAYWMATRSTRQG